MSIDLRDRFYPALSFWRKDNLIHGEIQTYFFNLVFIRTAFFGLLRCSLALLASHIPDLVNREQDHDDENTQLYPHAHMLSLSQNLQKQYGARALSNAFTIQNFGKSLHATVPHY